MFALEPIITDRVRTALGESWQVYGDSTDVGDHRPVAKPVAVVSFADANVVDTKTGAVNVQPAWGVTLAIRRGADAPAKLDAAFEMLVGALHNWPPGKTGDRGWNRMVLERVAPPQYIDSGLIGLNLLFSTTARYDGQP